MGKNKKKKAQKRRDNARKALMKEEQVLTMEKEEATLARFVELLADLNREVVGMLKTGDLSLLYEMSDTVAEIYAIQSVNQDELYTGIDDEAKEIYQNFNELVALAQSVGEDWSEEASAKVQAYLTNIFEANVDIVVAYGLAE